jgi:protein-L-isoaspartate O-methyltransferase
LGFHSHHRGLSSLLPCLGYESEGPYDAIHVGAAAPTLPRPLVDQLAKPGRMFIPVGTSQQVIFQVDKDADGNVTQKKLLDVMVRHLHYLPMYGANIMQSNSTYR